jgi:hypothetical protein
VTLLERFLVDLETDRCRFATLAPGDEQQASISRRMQPAAESGAWETILAENDLDEWAEVIGTPRAGRLVKVDVTFYFAQREEAVYALRALRDVWQKSALTDNSYSEVMYWDHKSQPPRSLYSFDVWVFSATMDPEDDPEDIESDDARYCVQVITGDSLRTDLSAFAQFTYGNIQRGCPEAGIDVESIRSRLESAGVDLASLAPVYDHIDGRHDEAQGFVIYIPTTSDQKAALVFYGVARDATGAWQLSGEYDVRPVLSGQHSNDAANREFLDAFHPFRRGGSEKQ